jgi:hypothetical protein
MVLVLAGCVGTYKVATNANVATIEFLKGYDKGFGLGAASVQFYSISREKCGTYQPIATMDMTSGPKAIKPVEANRAIYLEAYAQRYASTYNADCQNRVSFVPQPGARYEVVQRAIEVETCHLEVRSLSGAADPEVAHLRKEDCPKS